MARLFWLHDECLTRPRDLNPEDRWVYIWDQTYFNKQAWSLKRQVFVYETLCELADLGCEVYQADILEGLHRLLEQGCEEILTPAAQDPILSELIETAQQAIASLQLRSVDEWVSIDDPAPKRFFHYWKKVEKQLLSETQLTTHHRVR
ncbi:hypothetical protein P8S54_01165 [Thiomicrospira sp. R3]|uniref:hypothetical protein n=1 Tax=Thiomicrospira sp. R3 TaxID=3035472 RepID=UPI00259B6D1A|nr:hypothetical protein [Thiomicrospira sp. R3]WFE68936.1 hypothetical protein P8S54_01165 [Thiomicrospira sp. R3]